MITKIFEKIDLWLSRSRLISFIFSKKRTSPRSYQSQINILENKIEILELGIDKILLNDMPKTLSIEKSLNRIIEDTLSVGRFGDGEFRLMYEDNYSLDFQEYNNELSNKLRDIFEKQSSNDFNYMNGITWGYGGDPYFRASMIYTYNHAVKNKSNFLDAKITWRLEDHSNVELWKRIFLNKKLVIITGLGSDFIYNDDLFGISKSIQMVYTTPVNAWDNYDSLYHYCQTLDEDNLILLSLGPTATVLSFELAKIGFQALDIGALSNKFCEYQSKSENKTIQNDTIKGSPIYIGV